MASASKLRFWSRVLGLLALVVALIRLCLAVVRHQGIPWIAIIASVAICAIVFALPEPQEPGQPLGS